MTKAVRSRLELRMEKEGTFKPQLTPNPNRFGKCDMPNRDVYRYSVAVIATDQSLSPEGFIIDNVRIQTFFDTAYNGNYEMSCERMASFAARGIAQLLLSENISVVCVETKIGGSNGAWLTAKWETIK